MGARSRGSRRGANAVEFALVMPMLVMMIVGVLDYGWFFFRESLITNAMRDGVRVGGLQAPATNETSGCSGCVTTATTEAATELGHLGIVAAASHFTASVRSLDGGLTCAVVMTTSLTHESFNGILPMPTAYPVTVVAIAQNVRSCL